MRNGVNVPARGAKRRLAFALFLIVWLVKLMLGLGDAMTRHVPDDPHAVEASPYLGQIEFYVVIPSVFVAVNVFLFLFARKIPGFVVLVLLAFQLLVLFALLFFGAGGV